MGKVSISMAVRWPNVRMVGRGNKFCVGSASWWVMLVAFTIVMALI